MPSKQGVFRPERNASVPRMQGPQTAIVTGPSGEEIFVDEYGRVKIHYHWDRYGNYDDSSSCWVRVSQVWAGGGWGGMAIPRIGQEVIVDFIEGDPDQPIITGRVYNGENKTPYTLPADKTKTTIKSNSSIGGGGSNELRFEDKKGSEEVFIHAQKDQNNIVLNNETTDVGVDRTENIGNDETITIGNDRTETVGNDETINIIGNRKENVTKNETIFIDGNRTEVVKLDEDVNIKGEQSLLVEKSQSSHIKIDQNLAVDGDKTTAVKGETNLVITKDYNTMVSGNTTVVTDGTIDVASTNESITLVAPKKITLQVGASYIELDAKTGITIGTPMKVKVVGTERIELN